MARGGKRLGAGRKSAGDRVAVMVRLDRELSDKIDQLRDGRSMSAIVEQLLKLAMKNVIYDDDAANRALGFVLAQAANAADTETLKWRSHEPTRKALKLALPHIVDLFVTNDDNPKPHPMFKTEEEHARFILGWIIRRLGERGDEYDIDWPPGHPMRNFPRAAAALDFTMPTDKDADR